MQKIEVLKGIWGVYIQHMMSECFLRMVWFREPDQRDSLFHDHAH
jgi:hypothetical protein